MPDQSDRLDRIEAAIEQLVAADRRLQDRQQALQDRQEALQDRQEALAQSVELLTSLHTDNERRIAQIMDTMNRLANIVISHDQRLDDLENR